MTEPHIKRAIVTGPTGSVGTTLISELIENGAEVVAVARPNSKRIKTLPVGEGIKVVECDASDIAQLPEMIKGKYDAFFHLAWNGTYGESRQDWRLQETNIRNTVEAVYSAEKLGCSIFVGAGSQSEYGHVDGVLEPDGLCRPDTGYGAAKLAASEVSRALCTHLGIRHEWCRIVSLFGARDNSHSLVMSVIQKLVAGERPQCTNCEQMWDYIYSKDSARAFRLVAEKGKHGSIYLIASGVTRPLRDFVLDIKDVINSDAEIGFGEIPYYPDQAMWLEADISNLEIDTGFAPRFSFKDGVEDLLRERGFGNNE